MNAKKIMGAVLVALLAAALLVGAGAAATGGSVFLYQNVSGTGITTGTWTSNAGNQVTVGEFVEPVGTFVPGIYKLDSATLSVTYPAATITGYVGAGNEAYKFIDGTLYDGTTAGQVTLTNKSTATGITALGYYLIFPNTTQVLIDDADVKNVITNLTKGTYKFGVYFNISDFVPGTLADYVFTAPVTITVAEAGDATLTASVDQVKVKETFTVTVAGKPGTLYSLNFSTGAYSVPAGQAFLNAEAATFVNFTMPNMGKYSFNLVAESPAKEEGNIELNYLNNGYWNSTDSSVTLSIIKGAISAKTEAASYFVGDTVKVVGSSTAGKPVSYKVNGSNFGYESNTLSFKKEETDATGAFNFEFEINTNNLKNELTTNTGKDIDAGTYTITIKTDASELVTCALVLKQPFISIIDAPEVVVQDTKAEFLINAEAAEGVHAYIFGTNYFMNKSLIKDTKVKTQFKLELTAEQTDNMSAGQYFAVFQHPMYDTFFNIASNGSKIVLNETADAFDNENITVLFDVNDRQTANAAQALCDNLDSQNIDDMYVKYSFFVVGEDQSFTLSEIPTSVAQGETITISGTSTANADAYVTVEMISTAFAAVPKETVGSAAFIAVTTQIAEDGTWEVTLDTSDLNVDEYSLKVVCTNEDKPWKNVNINVVEAGDEPVTPPTDDPGQDEPGQDEPVAPETPGFGALAALAGLGAVAVLLLRRE